MTIRVERFGDRFVFLPKSSLKASDGQQNGAFPFFTSSSEQSKWTDAPVYSDEALVFATGGAAAVHHVTVPFATSADCLVASPSRTSPINARFAYRYLTYNINAIEAGFRGAGLRHVSKGFILGLSIPVPPLRDQLRIVGILENADKLRALRRAALAQLDSLTQSIFLDMFGNPIHNERQWPIAKLGEIARVERGKFTPRPRNDPRYYGGEFPFIQTGDISGCEGRLRSWNQTLNESGRNVSRSFPRGTVVIAIVGATLGATAILDIPVYCPDSVVGIRPHADKASAEYIEWILRFWRPIFVAQAPETARANINLETLRPLTIPVPSINLQQEFSRRVATIENLKSASRASLAKLDALFASLQHRAFRGEL